MQRIKPGATNGYAARRGSLRYRKGAGPQPSSPAPIANLNLYRLRMRNADRGSWATLVRRVRTSAGMSGAELARRLDIDRATIWRWEADKQRPESAETVQAFAELFGLDLDETLAAAGMRPGRERERPSPPVDPDVLQLYKMLADPDVPAAVKQQIRTMMRALLELAERPRQERPRRRGVS